MYFAVLTALSLAPVPTNSRLGGPHACRACPSDSRRQHPHDRTGCHQTLAPDCQILMIPVAGNDRDPAVDRLWRQIHVLRLAPGLRRRPTIAAAIGARAAPDPSCRRRDRPCAAPDDSIDSGRRLSAPGRLTRGRYDRTEVVPVASDSVISPQAPSYAAQLMIRLAPGGAKPSRCPPAPYSRTAAR